MREVASSGSCAQGRSGKSPSIERASASEGATSIDARSSGNFVLTARRCRKSRRNRKSTASGAAVAACACHSASMPKSAAMKRPSGRAASTSSFDRSSGDTAAGSAR